MSYEIYLGADSYWWWRLYDSGGRVIAHGTQGHASHARCAAEVDAVKASGSAPVTDAPAAPTGAGLSREAW